MQQSQKESKYDYMFKIIMVGTVAVGKSNILLRYTKNQYNQLQNTTIGVEFATKIIVTELGTKIKLQLWDTAGQERYKSMMKTFYRGAAAAIIVYDITRENTFLQVQNELKHISNFLKEDIIQMVVGNKADLQEQRQISKQRGLDFAQSKQLAFYEVSAKDGTNVDLIFTRLAQELQRAVIRPAKDQKQPQKPKSSAQVKKDTNKQAAEQDSKDQKQKNPPIVLNKKNEQLRKQQTKANKKCC